MINNEQISEEKMDEYFKQMLNKLKAKDPQFEDRIEFGKLLMKHINDLTPEERKRYDELNESLKEI